MTIRIGIVAAEPSGDLLAAGLMAALLEHREDIRFEGIGGPRMHELGMQSWFPMEKLSVMGLVEVLRHLPELLGIRQTLIRRWRDTPPSLFIGVDAPDFNLTLERKLRERGVPTVHYVCPTVWAWRPKRVHKIRRAVDLLLSIFPFEKEFLRRHHIDSRYVGHPLAQSMPLEPDRAAARQALGLDEAAPVLALLPGSRANEVNSLSRPFLQTAQVCAERLPGLQVVTPLANERTRALFDAQRALHAPGLSVQTRIGDTQTLLAAADVVLVASGTATLEGLLCKRPMVVGYKVHWLTAWIGRTFKLLNVENVAMANLLAGERLAPELIQEACKPEYLVPEVMHFFSEPERVAAIQARYRDIHQAMLTDTNREAAAAVLALLESRGH